MPRSDARMLGWNRACTFCDEPALGQWGTDEDAGHGASGILYTCYTHWDALKKEADRANTQIPGGDVARRPLFVKGTTLIGKIDRRFGPEIVTEGDVIGERN